MMKLIDSKKEPFNCINYINGYAIESPEPGNFYLFDNIGVK